MKNRQKHPTALLATILGWGAAAFAQSPPAVHGTGTANTIPVWTNTSIIGSSIMSQAGGNITVSGGLVATSLSGNGSGITGVSASTLGGLPASPFAQLGASSNTFTGSVSAASFSGNGSGVTNVNAATLGGLSLSAFAQLGASNTFTANQTINGTLTLGGAINNTLTLQGNLTDTNGNQGANVIGGFSGAGGVRGNSVASGVIGATIAGGGGSISTANSPNSVSGSWGTVGGGFANTAGFIATVSGGDDNTASGEDATVAGGLINTASGEESTVAGGIDNTASGELAMVAGGSGNTAAGRFTFAARCQASANNDSSFVWSGGADSPSTRCIPVSDSAAGQFIALAPGGFTFYTNNFLTAGVTVAPGSGSWSMVSDRNVKANFGAVDGQTLLARLAALPVLSWNYKAQHGSVRHVGPMAQDFHVAFGLGEDEKHISTVDAEGVALAAIQALYQTVTELKRDLSDKDQRIADLQARLAHLEQRQ